MPTRLGQRAAALARNEVGAIVILGIGAGAFLALGLFHLVRVTEAALWREGLQNAADAAAFDNAVIQARGMNVIAMLNVVMSVVMAVLLAMRILEIAVAILTVIMMVVTFISGGATAAADEELVRFESFLLRNDPKVAKQVVRICAGINVLEKVVATVTPPYATFHSTVKTWSDYRVGLVLAVNASLAPAIPMLQKDGSLDAGKGLTNRLKECKDSLAGSATPRAEPPKAPTGPVAAWETMAQKRMGIIFSLPVQEDRLGKLCGEASKRIDTTLPSFIAGRNIDLAPAGVSDIISYFPSIFCTPIDSNVKSVGTYISNAMKTSVNASCANQEILYNEMPDEKKRESSRFVSNGRFDRDKCNKDAKKSVGDTGKDAKEAALDAQEDILKCVKPAKVWEFAQNGQLPMQTFSGAVAAPSPFPVRAQAEMYFDCNGGWFGDDCDSKAMWKPNWRARLRRIQNLSDMLFDTASVAIAGSIANGLQKFIGEGSKLQIPALNKIPLAGSKLQTFVQSGTYKVPGIGTDLRFGGALGNKRDEVQQGIQGFLQDMLPGRDSANSDLIH